MLLSIAEIFSDKQNLVASAVSTNILDLGAPGTVVYCDVPVSRDIGPGTPIEFIYCLLFGALISPTDPIAALGILKKLGLNPKYPK